VKTIVISDIHNRVDWIEPYIQSLNGNYDEIVLLGDYFDNFDDTPTDAEHTARWLKYSICQPKRIHLLGNHDTWYAFPRTPFHCGGNTVDKLRVIETVMKQVYWQHVKICYFSQNFLFSHAGIYKSWALHPIKGFDYNYLQEICKDAIEHAKYGRMPRIFASGFVRGGDWDTIGGITWLDYDLEFKPIIGVNQIVGHSPHPNPLGKGIYKAVPNRKCSRTNNYCVDFHNTYVTIIENGVVSFEKNTYL